MTRFFDARRRHAALPLLIFVLGVLVAAVSSFWLLQQVERSAAASFERHGAQIAADISRRLSLAIYGLNGARGALAAHAPFTQDSFAAYVASRNLPQEFPGVRGLGLIERVPAAALGAYERQARLDDLGNFRLRALALAAPADPATTVGQNVGSDHFVIRRIEPAARNQGALGLDLSFEPRRRLAIDRAIDSGQPALSAPITLVQDEQRGVGFLLFVPVFEPGAEPDSPKARRAALAGVLFAPLVAAEVLDGMAATSAQDFGFKISLPGTAGGTDETIFQQGSVEPGAGADKHAEAGQRVLSRPVSLPGYDALLTVRSSQTFDAQYVTLPAWLTLLGGIFTSGLLAWLLHLQGGAQRRAEAIAERMTLELERLAMVAERTSNAVLITDRNLRITWVNEGFTRLYGYTLAQALGHTPGALLGTPQSDPAAIATLAAAAAAGAPCRVEVVNRTQDGRLIWLDTEVQPTLDEAGCVIGFVEIASDVTERRQAELQAATLLRENRALLGTIRAHTIVSMTDAAGTLVEVNDAFCAISGYSREELLGKSHAVINSGVQAPEFWVAMWQTIASGQSWRGSICNRARDGSLYWVDSIIAPITGADGRIEKYVSIRSDITASKRAALELATQRQRLADIIDGTEAGTWECDLSSARSSELDSGHVRISGAYAALIGRTVEECEAEMRPSFLALLHPADVDATSRALDDHLQGRTAAYASEYRMRHKQGHWVWIQSRGKVSDRDAAGRPLRISGIVLDVSVRKQAEREMSRQRRALSNIIEGTDAATWEWNIESGNVVFNTHWQRLTGCSAAELNSDAQPWMDRVHDDDRVRVRDALLRHFKGEAQHMDCEYRLRHADGHHVWLLLRGKVIGRTANGRARWMAGTHIDVSKRRLAEDALAASQAFLDQTGRIAGVGGWKVDLLSQTITWSDQTCRIHDLPPGHRPTMEEAVGYYTAEARRSVVEAVERSTRTGEGFDMELPMVTASGRAIWVRSLGNIETENGVPVRLVGAFQDTTARHTLQDEVRRNNALLSSVLANLPCGLSVFDGDGTLQVSNALFGELLGLPAPLNEPGKTRFEDLVRHNALRGEYGAGDVEAIVNAHLLRVTRRFGYQFERERPNGITLEVRREPMPSGGFLTIYADISARRRAEAGVERNERLLRAAIDAIDEAFVLYDPEDRLVYCNERYRQIYPFAAQAMVPGATFESIIRQGAESGEIPAAIGRVDAWVAERMRAHHLGETTPIQTLFDGRSLRVLERRLPDGHIVGFRIDITEMVRATEAANAASQAKSRFLANMSHEIRTPMNAILGMLALLRKTELSPRQADYAGKTEGAARSLLGLLNDILDFSKIEAGKMALDPQPFALEPLLQALSVILSTGLGRKPVELLFDIDPTLPAILVGDAMRLQQVLINLAGNAVKFTAVGEVVVSIARCGGMGGPGGEVTLEIAVRDSGIGIAPENQARIFSGFTQAEASTTRRFGGTGLGVVISQRLVALMGGELQLESALGLGSRFYFRLTLPVTAQALTARALSARALSAQAPTAQAAEAPAVVAKQLEATAPAALRVLVVDDHTTARELLQRMGESLGWQVTAAAGGAEAVTLLEEAAAAGRSFQAVFVDWQMPVMDGWQTSRRIREAACQPAVQIVMVTAHGRDLLAEQPAEAQALLDGFLVKPVTAAMLADALAEARAQQGGSDGIAIPATPSTPAVRRLAGLRLLVVEDNANNQQVARELLEDEGAQVTLAPDGACAVAAVAAAVPQFDAVLMDLQMPVMDGYTATSQIRQTLGLPPEQLPIVAMTANAMASDREACLAAGMNDHVGKPFDIAHLVALLQRLCGRSGTDACAADASAADAPPQAALPDTVRHAAQAAGVEIDAALARLGGKPLLYQRMLGGFITELEAAPVLLRQTLDSGDATTAARLAHTWRGVAATLGATALARAAANAETALRADPSAIASASASASASTIDTLVQALRSASADLSTLHSALRAETPQTPSPPRATPTDLTADRQALQQSLQALAELLEQSDLAALDANARLQARWSDLPECPLQPLDDAVGRLDFHAALQLCRTLNLAPAR